MILSVSPGELFLEPEFGCKINDMVFLPDSSDTITLAEYYIKQALIRWEPRIELKEVKGTVDRDNRNTLNLNIVYDIPALGKQAELDHEIDIS